MAIDTVIKLSKLPVFVTLKLFLYTLSLVSNVGFSVGYNKLKLMISPDKYSIDNVPV